MTLRNFAFALISVGVLVLLVLLKVLCSPEEKNYGWAVGFGTGMFVGAFGVWSAAALEVAAARGRHRERAHG
jgi:hypothetical protein